MIDIIKRTFGKSSSTTTPQNLLQIEDISSQRISQLTADVEEKLDFSKIIKQESSINVKENSIDLLSAVNTNTIITKGPLLVKIEFVLNSLNLMNNIDDSKINWSVVNKILFKFEQPFDYNINLPMYIDSVEQLHSLRAIIFMANNDLEPYYSYDCKICSKSFMLNYGEIQFYLSRNLYVPKRCEKCRKINPAY